MTIINASDIKKLRDKTNAGFMDCKKALTEMGGDFEAAEEWLRKKGLMSAAKKAGRVAAEGLVVLRVSEDGKRGVIVEVNAETDFVARNDKFQNMVEMIADIAMSGNFDLEGLLAARAGDKTVQEMISDHVATIGENMTLRRVSYITMTDGVVASYCHNEVKKNLGKIAVLVGLKSGSTEVARIREFGKQLAMHIAATRPESLNVSELDPKLVNKEREIFTDQARQSGKPDSIIEKMVEGRIRKFYEEVVFLEQIFVIDGKTKISEAITNFAKELGSAVEVSSFTRFTLGEGIEKEEQDFAAEVAKVAKS